MPGNASRVKKKKKSRLPLWLTIPIGIVLLAGSIWLCWHELKAYSLSEATKVLGELSWWRIAGSLAATILGYFALIGHDVIALQHLRKKIPLRRISLAAFIAYAYSNSAPVSFAVAGTLRLRYYSKNGLETADIGRLTGITLTTYALGLLTASAAALTIGHFPIPHFLPFHLTSSVPLGIFALLLLIGYVVWTSLRGKALGAKHHEALGPTLGFTASQIGISLCDWLLSGAALYVLMVPKHPLWFPVFFGVFILGQFVALIGQLPGGIGVFDAVMIWGLHGQVSPPATLAALFGYRVIYFLLPLILATVMLAATEGLGIRKRLLLRRGAPHRGS
ncbi:MAG TPA: lysylphosphatidylglycerol synthase domain-containing protein [Gemmatimonadales bacterium]